MVKLSLQVLLEIMKTKQNFRDLIEKIASRGSKVKREDPINLNFLEIHGEVIQMKRK